MKYKTGFFKVVETKTGKNAYAPDFLGEDWAYGDDDVDEGAEWVIDTDGTPLLLHESGTVFRPPLGKFQTVRATEAEFGWKNIVYEGDHLIVERTPGEYIHGTVKYGKFFVEQGYLSVYLGWYIDWDEGVYAEISLVNWCIDSSIRVHFFSPEEYTEYTEYKQFIEKHLIKDCEEERKSESQTEESNFVNSLDMEKTEQYMDIPSEEEIVNAFYAEEAGIDPDIAKLLETKHKYHPGDYKRRDELFSLLDKKM